MNREKSNGENGEVVAVLRCVAPRNGGTCGREVGAGLYGLNGGPLHIWRWYAPPDGAEGGAILDLAADGPRDMTAWCARHGAVWISAADLAAALRGIPLHRDTSRGRARSRPIGVRLHSLEGGPERQ